MTFSYFIATEYPYESIIMAGKWCNAQGKTYSVCYESHNSSDSEVLMASFLQYVMVTQVGWSWHREIKSVHRWDERELMLTKRGKLLMRKSSQTLYKSGLGNLKGAVMYRSHDHVMYRVSFHGLEMQQFRPHLHHGEVVTQWRTSSDSLH
jgi:hypothetical protein